MIESTTAGAIRRALDRSRRTDFVGRFDGRPVDAQQLRDVIEECADDEVVDLVEIRYGVLPEYTDERLTEQRRNSQNQRLEAESLLSIPADWRRSVWAEANAGLAHRWGTDEFDAAMLAHGVAARVTAFHAGHRPHRMEKIAPWEEGS